MATTLEMIEQMERAAAQAAQARAEAKAKSGNGHFVGNSIVVWKDGERALVRPIYNMDQSIVKSMHDKYKNTDVSLFSRTYQGNTVAAPISALCSVQFGKPCLFCAQPKEAKLDARDECFVPVYLYGIRNKLDAPITYTDPDGNVKNVRGFRMLRLKSNSVILNQLMSVYRNSLYSNDVTCCDFEIGRTGATKDDTTYSCTPNPPAIMNANLKAALPPREKFLSILEEIYPIRVLEQPAVMITPVQQAPTVFSNDTPNTARIAASAPGKVTEDDFVF